MQRFAVIVVALSLMTAGCAGEPACAPPSQPQSATPSDAPVFVSTGDPYQPGPLATRTVALAQCAQDAPRPLRIHAPQAAGDYGVVVFQHGFEARNSAYDETLDRLAAHGFVVVAPQMYEPGLAVALGHPTAAEEADVAAAILDWLPAHLSAVTGVTARCDRLGLAGHSRGGKVAWAVAKANPTRLTAIAGVDPVDGHGRALIQQPPVLDGPLMFPFPTLVLGAGLSDDCAPAGENHEKFYSLSASPAWHIVATDFGHTDMLDEGPAALASLVCPSGAGRAAMRQLTAGLLVAFFRAALGGDAASYALLSQPELAPATITTESK